ncbi:hypothetical protein JB92DRAFT_577207 [Gautieria morchelliformis]|nr:hypothetical protein JB92DRAFT_577207 [Gautieria morchelliformis]
MPLVPAKFTPPRDTETEEIPPKTRCSTMSFKLVPAKFPPQILPKTRKSKKQFNSEFLPLLEFAYEKNPRPRPEDKRQLAHISRMSFDQITDWFQNRRCRQDTPAKSKRVRPPAPKAFEEMKERLSDSAREALSEAHPFVKKLKPDPTEHHGDTPPESSTRAASSGVTEDAPSPGSCSDERVELTDHGPLGTAVYQLPISVEEHTPVAHSDNPLNHPKTSVHAYPAVYQPSQLTSDPVVVAPHAWLRDRRANTRESIDPTAEAVANTLSGFDRMDIDEPSKKMKKSKKQSNSEFLPLLEFAYEKNPRPRPEDKGNSQTSPGCLLTKSRIGSKTADADKTPPPNQSVSGPPLPRLLKR